MELQESAWVPFPADWRSDLQKLESLLLADASATVTVCDLIADAMEAELGGRRPIVVRNIPDLDILPTRQYLPLKQQLGLPEFSVCASLARWNRSESVS